MLGVFNAWLGDNSMDSAYTTTMGGNKYEYIMGVDRNNIINYTACGFTVGVKPADNTQVNIVNCVGFRKKYIVEITDKQLNI